MAVAIGLVTSILPLTSQLVAFRIAAPDATALAIRFNPRAGTRVMFRTTLPSEPTAATLIRPIPES